MIEAVEAANNTSYGLACSVFSQNGSRALRVAHQLEAGTAWVSHVIFTMERVVHKLKCNLGELLDCWRDLGTIRRVQTVRDWS